MRRGVEFEKAATSFIVTGTIINNGHEKCHDRERKRDWEQTSMSSLDWDIGVKDMCDVKRCLASFEWGCRDRRRRRDRPIRRHRRRRGPLLHNARAKVPLYNKEKSTKSEE